MANPKYATLTANTVATVTLDKDYDVVEVAIAAADASSNPVYFTVDGSTAPTAATDGVQFVSGSAGSFLQVNAQTDGATVVKLKSAGTPTVQVRGLREIGGGV